MMIVSARMIEDRLASQLKPAHLEVPISGSASETPLSIN
jgi:hypothetical protein